MLRFRCRPPFKLLKKGQQLTMNYNQKQKLKAKALFDSTRGSYLLGFALQLASRLLQSGKQKDNDEADAKDMSKLAKMFLCIKDVKEYDGRILGEECDE